MGPIGSVGRDQRAARSGLGRAHQAGGRVAWPAGASLASGGVRARACVQEYNGYQYHARVNPESQYCGLSDTIAAMNIQTKLLAFAMLLLLAGVGTAHAQDCVGGIVFCPDGSTNLCIFGCVDPGPLHCPGDCGCPGHMCGGIKGNLTKPAFEPSASLVSDRKLSNAVTVENKIREALAVVLPPRMSAIPELKAVPAVAVVKHGPSLPPDPWDVVAKHGPSLPPDPWDVR
jgi:hypothetical protein